MSASSTIPTADQSNPTVGAENQLPMITRGYRRPGDIGRVWVTLDFPAIPSTAHQTNAGVPYLTAPGVSMLAATSFEPDAIAPFVDTFSPDLEFGAYPDDELIEDAAAHLCKTAGQLCYLSLGPKRSMNADAAKYIQHIRESGHGSVFEHANFTMLFYGVSRSLTHELVRHRAGFAFSQVSQRYVSGKTLRFVMRPEFQTHEALRAAFFTRIHRAAKEYDELSEALKVSMKAELAEIAPTDRRKAVNQASRALLPNETEAPIIVTANARAWRHFLEMRGSKFAEPEVRSLAVRALACLVAQSPILFGDYTLQPGALGIPTIDTETRKV